MDFFRMVWGGAALPSPSGEGENAHVFYVVLDYFPSLVAVRLACVAVFSLFVILLRGCVVAFLSFFFEWLYFHIVCIIYFY